MAVELDKEEVIGLYETGMLQKEVAKKLGISVKTLSNFMKENGIETIINSVNAGYAPRAIEKNRTIKSEDRNLYIPEKWN
jgi:DNA invertase Pin-like site-specific DNA recombinase